MASALASKLKDHGLLKTDAYINGQWVTKSQKGETFEVLDPATTQKIATCPDLGISETREAIQHAQVAFNSWSRLTAKERAGYLTKLYNLMSQPETQEDLASLITAENGKPLADARGEVSYGASFFEWFAGEAVRDYGTVIPSPIKGQRNVVIHQGVGVCALICPWNFPVAMFTRKVSAALAAGCSVVMKAPAETPLSALALAELCHRAGIPPGVVNVITTDKYTKDIGKEMCENTTVRKLSFTGSTPVGKLLMTQSAPTLKKLSLELGGNSPFIVFDDADLDKAIEGALNSKFRSSGQTCVCANRIYVHSSVYAEFASRLASKVDQFKLGNGFDKETTHGPLIHQRAIDKVEHHVKDAVAKGAQVLVGGRRAEELGPFFYEPTVLSEVKPCAINDEETFGPVAALYRFETEQEVLDMCNDSPVGLAGYFYSRDIGRVWRVAEALEVGMVGVNTGLISNAVIPFGGVKESGFGREGSKYGMHEYQIVKYIAMGGLGGI